MKQYKFKTNINCGGCIASVTPTLNKTVGENNWNVDTVNPQKVLTINTDALNEEDVIKAVKNAGYHAELLADTKS